jgi:hypothetical protein
MVAKQFKCANCGAGVQPLRRSNDFFCRACFTSMVVIDDRWIQMMRASDKIPQTIPFSAIEGENPFEHATKKMDHRALTGPLGK